uniref:Cation_ATPase_N domain-containing protein n=1 Tax=Haemonchus contortus TaxID=6289 RepID=A0A7I4YPQ8_HAECO
MNTTRANNQSGALTCGESLQRAPSPVLFPENVPGAAKVNTEHDGMLPSKQRSFRTDLSPDDVKLVNELGRLTPDQLADYIKNVQNTAYSLGIEEARQFSRGKMLQIFSR